MAQITWTAEAERWLEDIFEYIAADNSRAAAETIQGIYDQAQSLKDFPEMGYRYRASARHVRILLYGHYRITYLRTSSKTMEPSTSLVCFTAHSIFPSTSYRWPITTRWSGP